MEALLTVEVGDDVGRSCVVRPGKRVVIGRAPGVGLLLRDATLQGYHAEVRFEGASLVVLDLCGATKLNGAPLVPRVPTAAAPGDELSLGAHVLRIDGSGFTAPTRPVARPGPLVPPEELEVLAELGRGAMGRVLHARRRSDGLHVAVKVLHKTVASGDEDMLRFLREGLLGQRISDRHVVGVHEVKVWEGRALIVMELVVGPSAQALVACGPLAIPDALRVAEDVARGLEAAHAARVVHRDVKPANVLLSSEERVCKLADLGIAKDLEEQVRALTDSGVGLGTLAYLAPEQASSARRVDGRADLYALGATLYHLLAGDPPFATPTVEALLKALRLPPPPLSARRPDVPPEVESLVLGLLAKDPSRRPPSAGHVAERLRTLRTALWPSYRPDALFGAEG